METIKIKVSEKIMEKVLSLFQQFDKEDLQVIHEQHDFEFSESELKAEYQKIKLWEIKNLFFRRS